MKIAIAADHAGFVLKEELRRKLLRDGHEVVDFGTDSEESCDYPDFAQSVAREVAQGRCDRGILVCGTGIGMAMAANKVTGVRAAPASMKKKCGSRASITTPTSSRWARALSRPERAAQMVDIFLDTEFLGGRHSRRVAKIAKMEMYAGLKGEETAQ